MVDQRRFEKPAGFRDYPPPLAEKKRALEEKIRKAFCRWGYQEVLTPTLEYFETVGEASVIEEKRIFKLIDREGKTLALRPDQTAPIARVVSTSLGDAPLPLRLFYQTNVFRAQEERMGRDAEFFQSGVELIGEPTPEGDAEVIALAVEVLQICKIPSFRLVVGHVGLLHDLLQETVGESQMIQKLKQALRERDNVGYRQLVQEAKLSTNHRAFLLSLLSPKEQFSLLEGIQDKFHSSEIEQSVAYLRALWEALQDYGVSNNVTFDPLLTGSLSYYTGVYFEGYANALGFPLLSGGRYDRLMERFGRSAGATGFAIKIDRLMEVCLHIPCKTRRIAILFSQKKRKEAITKAMRLRKQGLAVVLQPIDRRNKLSEVWKSSFTQWIELREEEGDEK